VAHGRHWQETIPNHVLTHLPRYPKVPLPVYYSTQYEYVRTRAVLAATTLSATPRSHRMWRSFKLLSRPMNHSFRIHMHMHIHIFIRIRPGSIIFLSHGLGVKFHSQPVRASSSSRSCHVAPRTGNTASRACQLDHTSTQFGRSKLVAGLGTSYDDDDVHNYLRR